MSDQYFHQPNWSVQTAFGEIQLIVAQKFEGDSHAGSGIIQVPDATTDKQVVIAWPAIASGVKSLVLISDVAMTVEFNDGTTPDATLILVGGVPYIWNTNSYDTCKNTTAVTALYLTNASGSAGQFIADCVFDGTP